VIIYTRPYYHSLWYPYILITPHVKNAYGYLANDPESVIIDSGVHKVFHELGLREYPGGYKTWISRVAQLYYYSTRFIEDVYAVVPDYPSDYPHNPVPDNVERTNRNIEYALDRYPDVRWIVPIQGKPDSVASVSRTIELLAGRGLLTGYVAVASTCVTRSPKFLHRLAVVARSLLRGRRIHMFGTTMKAWGLIARYVDSTDTITLSLHCRSLYGRMCCKTEEYLQAWGYFLELLRKGGYISGEVYSRALGNPRPPPA